MDLRNAAISSDVLVAPSWRVLILHLIAIVKLPVRKMRWPYLSHWLLFIKWVYAPAEKRQISVQSTRPGALRRGWLWHLTGRSDCGMRLSRAKIRSITSLIWIAPPGRAAATRLTTKSWLPWSSPSALLSGSFYSMFISPASSRRLVTRACVRAMRSSWWTII